MRQCPHAALPRPQAIPLGGKAAPGGLRLCTDEKLRLRDRATWRGRRRLSQGAEV